MRILFTADLRTPNAYYRALTPMLTLAERGHKIRETDASERAEMIRQFDVLLIHRHVDREIVALSRTAHRHGLAVVWDNDDDFAAINRSMPAYRELGGLRWERRLTDMRRIFEIAELVSSPSRHLSQIHSDLGARAVSTIPNRVSKRELRRPQTRKGIVTIGWVAGGEHRFDDRELATGAMLGRVLERLPHVRVESLGLSLGLPSDRYVHHEVVPLRRLVEHVSRWDIGIAPLADLQFSRARSDVKLREYAAAGVPWLASPVGPYVGMGSAQGGELVEAGDWEAAVCRLACDDKRRKKLSKAARNWASAEALESHAEEWERMLEQAIAARRAA